MLEDIKARAEQQARLTASKQRASQPNTQVKEPSTTCSKCGGKEGTLNIWYEEREFTKLVDGEPVKEKREVKCESWTWCECYYQKRVLTASRITEDFKEKGFKNFFVDGRPPIVREMFEKAKRYVRSFEGIRKQRRNSIALLGNPGVGKTRLLMAACNNLMAKGVPVTYFPWVETWNEIKDDFDLLNQRVNLLKESELLFIDDLFKGRQAPTPFQLEQLFAIVNYRYMEKKPIMLSSERSFADMLKIDEGIGSRLYQMCKDYTIEVQGDPFELNYRLVEGD
ncbi:ATP-binding protein [Brevibacillus borstelensis]|uniref:ATP-binding protein n=1 Tax=Brevibacillus borstelensis TaxID=45462 RepID=UPI0009E06ABF|nr:ATP-binding protein [Brevibacillus borstelensis]